MFRLFITVYILLQLTIYQGDINTAFLNALLEIKQYLDELEGYPCEEDSMTCMVNKALYGLKRSGREWNSEVNAAQLNCVCIFYDHDGEFAIVLLYVEDILCATKNEQFKQKMFSDLDKEYGLKDQGPLSTYLGVEVEQDGDSMTTSRPDTVGKY
ncbi:Copiatype Polyprotein [Phytophthora palmivora]|uniref:Copiatype Polyprotein n=1 Tax=Phytophthora palmivora TaxID=4796 RepID=A0A2P4X348_9STRA|nr:Copiatype Polyprotein [Phytophthora palmivora]